MLNVMILKIGNFSQKSTFLFTKWVIIQNVILKVVHSPLLNSTVAPSWLESDFTSVIPSDDWFSKSKSGGRPFPLFSTTSDFASPCCVSTIRTMPSLFISRAYNFKVRVFFQHLLRCKPIPFCYFYRFLELAIINLFLFL